jgi:outer membrane protein
VRLAAATQIRLRLARPVLVAALLAAILPAWGADLLEVYGMAQGSDPTFEVARLNYAASQEKRSQALAGNLPTVTLTGNENFTDAKAGFNGTPPVSRGIYAWTWTLQLTQPIMHPQNVAAYYEADAQVDAARADFEQAQQELMLRVAQAYFDALIAQETVATAEAQVQAMQEQAEAAKRGYEKGTISITDYHEADSKAEQSRAQLIAAQGEREVKQSELERLTGQPTGKLAILKPEVVIPSPQPVAASDWVSQAQDSNPAVRAQMSQLRAAGFSLTKARAENIWTLDFVASTGNNYSSGSVATPVGYESRVKSNVAGLQFTMPIFAGGLNSSHIREATINREKLGAQLEEARRKAGAEARQAYIGIMTGLAQAEALRASVKSAESSVKGNRAGYKFGLRINSDVLNAEQQLYSSRRDLVKARYDTLLQGLKLKAAAGVLTVSDLVTVNDMLEKAIRE